MSHDDLRTQLWNLGVTIAQGEIPSIALESPIEMKSLVTVGPCSIGAFTYGANLFLHHADIGRYCSIAPDVCIGLGNHRTDLFTTHPLGVKGGSQFAGHPQFHRLRESIAAPQTPPTGRRTRVGNDVWIGQGALVNDGATIGDGAIIGAGAVVTGNIPAYAIAVGVPARVIRFRFDDDMIARFQRLRWWDLDLSALADIPVEPLAFLETVEAAVAAGSAPPLAIETVNVGPAA
jgi:acetyltransferase-like isoleucine patch superfamily enzyme